jgi:hypothetical protein
MNLPAVSSHELLDQKVAADERSALWSRALVRALVERESEPRWFPIDAREEPVRAAS